MLSEHIQLLPEVRDALGAHRPVVALESTIIAYGMPRPENLETARRVEEAVRSQGAVPATIAIVAGTIRVGLEADALELIGRNREVRKASRRDLAILVARGLHGATTVAATMWIAAAAGIRVMVTGGIGGVHRGAERSFDVSADLRELAGTRVAVVCAGAKSIVDPGLTLEYLETHGVPVLGLGTDRFPAFFVRDSGFKVDARVESEDQVAAILKAQWDLGLAAGMVVANPIPEADEMDPELLDRATRQALAEARERGVRSQELTPFLLSRIEALSGGESLKANVELVLSNARVGARLARELCRGAKS